MLKELFETIGAQAIAAREAKVIHPDAEPPHRYLIQQPDGTTDWAEAEPAPRNHTVGSAEALIEYAGMFKGTDTAPILWYSRAGVVLLTDDTTRRDRVSLPLALSPQLAAIQSLEAKPRSFKQRELILFLRTTLHKCFEGGLTDVFRKVKFRASQVGDSELAHGRSSIGKQLTAELTGTGAIPEYAVFAVPIFASGFDAKGQIECAIEVLPDSEEFQLIPIPGQVEAAIGAAETKLGTILVQKLGEDVPAFYGTP